MWALDDALAERGIEIPFPQRDLHVKGGALEVRLTQP
jgi:small-conductance mechanosensitive channel